MKKPRKKDIQDIAALTPMQEGMLFHHLKEPDGDHYFEQLSLDISGEIHFRTFVKAWHVVIAANEMLRAVFRWEKQEKPVQIILREHKPEPSFFDLSPREPDEKQGLIEEIKWEARHEISDLHRVPFKVILCKIEKNRYEMIVSNHHILYDGWSSGIILNEFFNAYHDLVNHRPPEQHVKTPFKEFVKWLKQRNQGREKEFWKDYLKDSAAPGELPVKFNAVQKSGRDISRNLMVSLGKDIHFSSREFIRKHKITMAALLYTAWGILLQKYCGSRDVIYGTTVAGRSARISGIENIVGLFINTIPLRIETRPGEKILHLLKRINNRLQTREAYENTPLVDIKQNSPWGHHKELFNSIVVIENYPLENRLKDHRGRLSIAVNRYWISEMTHYDLNVAVNLSEEIEVRFIYKKGLFESGVIERLSRHFTGIWEALITNSRAKTDEIDMLFENERLQVLIEFNSKEGNYPLGRTLHRLFTDQVERTPDQVVLAALNGHIPDSKSQIAKKFGGNESITYVELNKRADGLAHSLKGKGVEPGTIVGLMAERSVEMILGILGILKAGCGYVPLDPKAPGSRTEYILGDCSTRYLLTHRDSVRESEIQTVITGKVEPVYIEDLNSNKPAVLSVPPVTAKSTAKNLAYIIYTSGSTGKPKGVPITHANLAPLLHWGYRHMRLTSQDRTLQNLSYFFDWSVWEIFIALTSGSGLWITSEDTLLNPGLCLDFMQRCDITVLHITPTQYQALANGAIESGQRLTTLKCLAIGAEKLSHDLVKRSYGLVSETCRIFNMYGPTEATIMAAVLEIDPCHDKRYSQLSSIPIGPPIANTHLLVVDHVMNLCPLYVPGELMITGDGLASGYLNNPELTFEKFVNYKLQITKKKKASSPHHTNIQSHQRLIYMTGDRVRWLPEGSIEFLGRADTQVKIRGYRIESGEIESQLLKHEDIKEAVVIAGENQRGERYLCAYLVGSDAFADTLNRTGLREFLSHSLPGYMIPAYFIRIARMPLTPNGKIDYNVLPEPDPAHLAAGEYTAPTDELEKKLVEIWSGILGIPVNKIGLEADFFEMGGHSLRATSLVAMIHKEFQVLLSLTDVFTSPTVNEQAHLLKKSRKQIPPVIRPTEKKEYYRVAPAQSRMYVLNQREGISTTYNISGAVKIEGELSIERLEKVFQTLIERHEAFRTSFTWRDGEPAQEINDKVEFKLEYVAFHQLDKNSGGPGQNFIRPFDLSRAPLLRVGLNTLQKDLHILMVDMHHIIADGVSVGILVREFIDCYSSKELHRLKLQYKDYSEWLPGFFRSNAFINQEKYWLKHMKPPLPVLNMPLDFPRPEKQCFDGRTVSFTLCDEITEKLNRMVNGQKVTLNILFLAIYAVLLSKYCNQEELILGSLAAGRRHAHLGNIIGMFLEFSPIRLKIDPGATFSKFLEIAKHVILNAYENQDYPMEKIIQRLDIPTDLSRNPLFDTLVNFRSEEDEVLGQQIEREGLKFSPHQLEHQTAKLDILIDVFPFRQEGITCFLEYNRRLFKEETITKLIGHFKDLIHWVTRYPDERISQVELFTMEEGLSLSRRRPKIRLAISATFTSELMANHLEWWAHRFGPGIDIAFAPYNQVFRQLLDESGLFGINRGINLLLVRFEDFVRFMDLPAKETCDKLEVFFQEFVNIFKARNKTIPYFVGIFPVSTHLSLSPEVVACIEGLNTRWKEVVESYENAYLIDFTGLADLYRIPVIFNRVMDRTGHMPFSREYYAALGTMVARHLNAWHHSFFKVILLDCDNTLWQGSCKKRGASGVTMDTPHLELQQLMLQKYQEGMKLVLGSRNSQDDVWDVFEKKPQMVLKKSHFAGWQFLCRSISQRVRELAAELDLELHSFIFISGCREECREMMLHCPEVLTLAMPEQAEQIPLYLKHVWALDQRISPHENPYSHPTNEFPPPTSSMTLSGYLHSLRLKISMTVTPAWQVEQAAQLSRELNYFNLSMIQRDKEKLQALLNIPEVTCWSVEVSDRFGDYGLMGVVITVRKDDYLFIDTFLLNCRVFGRGVEDAVLVGLRKYCEEYRLITLKADFYPAKDNQPMQEFLRRCWNPEREHQEYTSYVLPCRDIPGEVKYGEFYFREAFKTGQVISKPAKVTTAINTPLPAAHTNSKEPDPDSLPRWDVFSINRENLLHQEQLLPLEYPSGSALLDLFTGKNKKNGETGVSTAGQSPSNKIQRKLLGIWQELLKITNIGMDTSFFHLGGNSLKGVMLAARIQKEFHVEIPLAEITRAPFISKLAALISESRRTYFPDMEKVENKEFYELSYNQQRIWLLNQLEPGTSSFNMASAFMLEHEVEEAVIKKTIALLMQCHESLRTGFKKVGGKPVQFIAAVTDIPLQVLDISGRTGNEKQETREQIYRKMALTPFDITRVPLFRVVLLKWDTNRYEFMFNLHHLITDGWSMEVLYRDFRQIYEAHRQGKTAVTTMPELQYRDFVHWHNQQLADEEKMQQAREFWKNQLSHRDSECSAALDLPYDYPKKNLPDKTSAGYRKVIPTGVTRGLKKIARENRASLFMVLLAGYNLLLSRVSGQTDILLGAPGVARQYEGLENIIGIFVNTLILRNKIDPGESFPVFLQKVQDNTLKVLQYQDYPLDLICSEFKIKYPEVTIFFNMLIFTDTHTGKLENFESYHIGQVADAAVEIDIYLKEYQNAIEITTHYYKGLFKPVTIEKTIDLYIEILENISRDPGQTIGQYQSTGMKRRL